MDRKLFGMLTKPECCISEEMDCGTCLRTAAVDVARCCGRIDQGGVRGIFWHLYSHPFCKSKQHLFERAYLIQAGPVPAASAA
jgi:hypothetical protein